MTRNAEIPICRRPDGSIDTAFYLARGRRMRSRQAHHLLNAVCRSAGLLWFSLNRRLNAVG